MNYIKNIEILFNNFHNSSNTITSKQIILLNKIIENQEIVTTKNNILNFYKIDNIEELKHYEYFILLKHEFYISNYEKLVLKYYFKNEFVDKIKEVLPEFNTSDISNSNFLLDKLHKKHLKKLYSQFPKLTLINTKYDFILNSQDYPLVYNENYEYGYQIKKDSSNNNIKFYYLKFYDWCCIDIDLLEYNDVIILINKYLNVLKKYIFVLYKTPNGFHLHVMNKRIEYNSLLYEYLSIIFKNDVWYYNYSKKIGYKLRLSKKFENDFIAEYVNTYIPDELKNKSTDLNCNYYKYIYNSYLNKFKTGKKS